jgi:hypothetical protein
VTVRYLVVACWSVACCWTVASTSSNVADDCMLQRLRRRLLTPRAALNLVLVAVLAHEALWNMVGTGMGEPAAARTVTCVACLGVNAAVPVGGVGSTTCTSQAFCMQWVCSTRCKLPLPYQSCDLACVVRNGWIVVHRVRWARCKSAGLLQCGIPSAFFVSAFICCPIAGWYGAAGYSSA